MTPQPQQKTAQALVTLVFMGGLIWYFFLGGLNRHAASEMGRIEQQVAGDQVQQYGIAKRGGSSMEACVHAGMVAAAYIQAKDEGNYRRWKEIERGDCAAAGLPR